jgi:hypothetical protein
LCAHRDQLIASLRHGEAVDFVITNLDNGGGLLLFFGMVSQVLNEILVYLLDCPLALPSQIILFTCMPQIISTLTEAPNNCHFYIRECLVTKSRVKRKRLSPRGASLLLLKLNAIATCEDCRAWYLFSVLDFYPVNLISLDRHYILF